MPANGRSHVAAGRSWRDCCAEQSRARVCLQWSASLCFGELRRAFHAEGAAACAGCVSRSCHPPRGIAPCRRVLVCFGGECCLFSTPSGAECVDSSNCLDALRAASNGHCVGLRSGDGGNEVHCNLAFARSCPANATQRHRDRCCSRCVKQQWHVGWVCLSSRV